MIKKHYDTSVMERMNHKKLVNAILFFNRNVKNLGKTKLYKLLYFLDFTHFKETGKSVTGLEYYAWDFGPVPRTLFNDLDQNKIPQHFEGLFKIVIKDKLHQIHSEKRPNLTVFSKREQRILKNLADIYKYAQADTMTEISHLRGKPWDNTIKENGEYSHIDYLLAIDDAPESLALDEAKERQAFISETYQLIENG